MAIFKDRLIELVESYIRGHALYFPPADSWGGYHEVYSKKPGWNFVPKSLDHDNFVDTVLVKGFFSRSFDVSNFLNITKSIINVFDELARVRGELCNVYNSFMNRRFIIGRMLQYTHLNELLTILRDEFKDKLLEQFKSEVDEEKQQQLGVMSDKMNQVLSTEGPDISFSFHKESHFFPAATATIENGYTVYPASSRDLNDTLKSICSSLRDLLDLKDEREQLKSENKQLKAKVAELESLSVSSDSVVDVPPAWCSKWVDVKGLRHDEAVSAADVKSNRPHSA